VSRLSLATSLRPASVIWVLRNERSVNCSKSALVSSPVGFSSFLRISCSTMTFCGLPGSETHATSSFAFAAAFASAAALASATALASAAALALALVACSSFDSPHPTKPITTATIIRMVFCTPHTLRLPPRLLKD
ncbi:uncharacterized protein METZ01_LOCUS179666, partial [marine metagenome]